MKVLNLKRLVACGSAAVFTLSLMSCGSEATKTKQPEKKKHVVGVILPDKTSSARYVEQDQPLLGRALGLAGAESRIENANGNVELFNQIADRMIREKVDVLMITPLTSESGTSIEKSARAAEIPVINYDRLSRGGVADYHVAFNSVMVGQQQAEGLIRCLAGKPSARIVELEGSPTDGNAGEFAEGHRQVMADRYADGSFKLVKSQFIDNWDAAQAKQVFRTILDESNGAIDGVLAANDGLAGAVLEVLAERNLVGKVQVTGQDATLAGLRAVLRGDQCMTVHKPIRDEAEAAARMAVELAARDFASADDLATGNSVDKIGKRDVKALLLSVDPVFRDNIRTMVTQRVVKAGDLCAGDLANYCTQADIVF